MTLPVRASAFTISIRTCSLVLYDLDSNRGALASTISNSTHGQFADKTMSAWPLNEHMPKSTTSMCRYRAQKRPAYRGLLFSVLSLRGRVLLRRAWPSRRRALLESFSVYRSSRDRAPALGERGLDVIICRVPYLFRRNHICHRQHDRNQ